MAMVMIGEPKPFKTKGRKPIFDELIKNVAGKSNKYIYENDRNTKETIRKRAKALGYSIQTFADKSGGWNIKIF